MLTPEQVKQFQTKYGLTNTNGKVQSLDERISSLDTAVNSSQTALPDVSSMSAIRKVGTTNTGLPVMEYLDKTTGKYVPESEASLGLRLKSAGSKLAETFIDPAAKLIASGVRAPVDVIRGLVGKDPLQNTDVLPSGMTSKSIQAGFAEKVPKVISGEMTPLEATAGAVGETVGGAVDVLGAGGLVEKAGTKIATLAEQALETRRLASLTNNFSTSINEAKNVLNPSKYYSPSEKSIALQKGNVEISGKGPFTKEKIIQPTTQQTETIAELVNNGKVSSKNLPSQNIQAIQQESRAIDAGIDELVSRPELNKPYNGNTIAKVYDNVFNSAKKELVFVPDSTEQKAYQAVIDVAKEEIAKQSFNMAGLRKGIKAFNVRMQRILGSDIYSGASESVGNARVTAAKDVRTALNNFLADNLEAPRGTIQGGELYKSQIKKEAQLLNAVDEIAYRASKTVGKSTIQQFIKKHPVVVKGVATATAGYVGYDILKELGL